MLPNRRPESMGSGTITVTWLGHSAFQLITPRNTHLLVDPWLEGNPMQPVGDTPVTHADAILVTHAHCDHAGNVVRLSKKFGSPVVCIHEVSRWFARQGVTTCLGMNKGGTVEVAPGISATMVHADHSCGIPDNGQIIYGGDPCGYVIEFDNGTRVYHAGDRTSSAT